MNRTDQGRDSEPVDAIQHHIGLCLLLLSLLLLFLVYRGLGAWSFLPVLVGIAGVLLRWRLTPVLPLLLLAGLLFVHETLQYAALGRFRPSGSGTFNLLDWLLCAVVLGYVAVQYRLRSLARGLFPAKPREPVLSQAGTDLAASSAAPRNSAANELGGLLVALPVWALAAQIFWNALPAGASDQDVPSQTTKAIILVWTVILGILAVGGLLSYIGWRRLLRPQALLLLQDLFWQETLREQRRVSYWLMRDKLRRRKERS